MIPEAHQRNLTGGYHHALLLVSPEHYVSISEDIFFQANLGLIPWWLIDTKIQMEKEKKW